MSCVQTQAEPNSRNPWKLSKNITCISTTALGTKRTKRDLENS